MKTCFIIIIIIGYRSNVAVFGLEEHGQDTKDCHEDDGEGLPGDGGVAPGLDCDGGGGEASDEHGDEIIVVPGHISLHIGSVQSVYRSHSLLVNTSTDEGEDEAPDAEDGEAGDEGNNTDGTEGGVEFYGEVEESGEEKKILER